MSTRVVVIISFAFPSSGLLALLGHVLVEHLDGVVDQPDPAVAAGVVGQLLVGEAGAEGGEQVERLGVGDAAPREQLADLGQVGLGDRERLGRGLEAGDRALEQQLVAGEVGRAELDEEVARWP